ncbi:MAG: enhanced serine sensitivity protein SseB [Erysipelotrichaceae bacterium]
MDINKPIENLVLLELLDKLKAQFNADTEHEFFKELLSTKFLSPITQDSLHGCKSGESTLKEGATIKFIHLNDEKGNSYLPVFTDWNELKKWNETEGIKTLILSFEDYKTMILENNSMFTGFVLNPFGHNIMFDKNLIQQAEENVSEKKERESVMIGVPEKYPHKMIEALKDFLPSIDSVKSAYLLLMVRREKDTSYLLVVETDGNLNDVFGKIAKVVTKYLSKEELIDFVPLSQPFGKSAVEGQEAFYKK